MDSSYKSELIGVFLGEVEGQLQTIDQEILKLEQERESEETIQSLFRAAHTLKGSSSTMGFKEMKHLTHEMEHILHQVRNHRLPVTNLMIDLLFICLDRLKMLKEEFSAGKDITIGIDPLINELKTAANSETGKSFLLVRIRIAEECMMKLTRAFLILNELHVFGDVLKTVPPIHNLEENEASSLNEIQCLLATETEASLVRDALLSIMDVVEADVSPVEPHERGSHSRVAAAADVIAPDVAAPDEVAYDATGSNARPNEKRTVVQEGKGTTQTIRVDVQRLEHLMNLVGELVIGQTRIKQIVSILHKCYTSDENVGELGQISNHLSRIVGELQESVMKVRMLPIGQLFNRFPRMVRDLAHSLGKEIDLIIEGRETELDRTIIEEIGDPLIHLIRNAVDHGIETAEERQRSGKPLKGRLRITAAHEENQVVITVEDDGAGIDSQKIKDTALRKGIVSEKQAKELSAQEALNLIFSPGFSTVSSVSEISGRGVGMDIVRNHIEKLNGMIDIESELGAGTWIKIKLPLTLAIISGLLIKLNERTYILPMSNVVEIVRMPSEAIQTIKGESVIVIRGQVLPVYWLHDYFHLPRRRGRRNQLTIVVVGAAEKRVALVVDELNGNQEIVVKSLGAFIGKTDFISGATILGDGQVALILELTGIGRIAGCL